MPLQLPSEVIADLLGLIEGELSMAGADPARHAWLTRQRNRFTSALSSARVQSDPGSVARLVLETRFVRSAILSGDIRL